MACLFMYGAVGEVSLDRLYLDVAVTSSETTINIHPTWEVLASKECAMPYGCLAFAFGNVMVIRDSMTGERGDYARAHEGIHLNQFRALGWLMYPAQYVLPIEPPSNITTNLNDLTQPARTMWQPPKEWKPLWSFITFTFDT